MTQCVSMQMFQSTQKYTKLINQIKTKAKAKRKRKRNIYIVYKRIKSGKVPFQDMAIHQVGVKLSFKNLQTKGTRIQLFSNQEWPKPQILEFSVFSLPFVWFVPLQDEIAYFKISIRSRIRIEPALNQLLMLI